MNTTTPLDAAAGLNADVVREAAHGRWPAIFAALGIEVGNGKHGPCPCCGGTDRFRFDDQDGRGTWFCNQCDPKAGDGLGLVMNVRGCDFSQAVQLVADALGHHSSSVKTPRKIVAEYNYSDEAGTLLFQAVRYQPKDFHQRRPDGQGGWVWSLKGVRNVLYRLPELAGRVVVYVVEGEKDCDRLRACGLFSTTNAGGAEKWTDEHTQQLKAAGVHEVRIPPDNDQPGQRHAQAVARSCVAAGLIVKLITIPGLPLKGDVSDFLDAGGTVEGLNALADAAPLWTKEAETVQVIPLDDPALPAMPSDVLPSWLNSMVMAVAHHTETPPELAAGFGLAVVATCCQQRVIVEVEPGYTEPLNIWPVTALESGNRKTAVMKQMVAPLIETERRLCEASKEKIAIVESERETIRAKVKALRTEAAEGVCEDFEDKKQAITKLETSMPDLPTLPRLWVQDITPEKLGMVMAENGERLTILSDEGGLFDILAGRYSSGIPNLDLFLQAHAGASVRVHRGSRPDVIMDQPALTIALSPQPDVLKGLAAQPAFRGRGLLARILYALPSSRLGHRDLKSHPIQPHIVTTYQAKIEALLKIAPTKNGQGDPVPHVIALSKDAHQEWKEFQKIVEKELRDGGTYEYIRDWAGKLPGAAARLAGLFHCADHAETLSSNLIIKLDTMIRALSLAAFYSTHALAVFDIMGADLDLETARKVWRWIAREQKTSFTARDCFQALRGSYPRMEQLNPAFAVLLERGYLIEQAPSPESTGKPGRKSRMFLVNPTLTEQKELT